MFRVCLGDGQAWRNLGFSKNKAKSQSLRLQGKSGPMVSVEASLTRDGLFSLWYGAAVSEACNLPDDYKKIDHSRDAVTMGLVDFENEEVHLYCESSWLELAAFVNKSLGIKDASDLPVMVDDLRSYLTESRRFRARFPQLDRISKRAFHAIQQETTWNKFRASYGYEGLIHVGSGMLGRMSCIGCPDAFFCDPLLNGMRWEDVDFGDGDNRRRVVSDVALPNESKTGMGEDPLLYSEMRRGPCLYKINFNCLTPEDMPVYKGREHNEEVIAVSQSWGPCTAIEVVKEHIAEVNGLRNILCQRMLKYSDLRDKPIRAPVSLPDVHNPDFSTFFSFSDVQAHLRNQLKHVVVRKVHDHRVLCQAFDQTMFDKLIACEEAYFNPCQAVPQKLFNSLKKKSLSQLRVTLPSSGLSATQAANVYLWKDAVRSRKIRLGLVNAMVDLNAE